MPRRRKYRRSTGVIHLGHLTDSFYHDENRAGISMSEIEVLMQHYFDNTIKKKYYPENIYRAGTFSLEVGKLAERPHINFYVERLHPASSTTWSKSFETMETSFDWYVKDPKGAWEYCSQSGRHSDKEGVIEIFQFGDPALYGGTAQNADLRKCVDLLLNGATPTSILQEFPYAYAVHRGKIWRMYQDLQTLERYGRLSTPPDLVDNNRL